MKKQNFFYTLLFCMMAMVVSFASCSDDDDDNYSSNEHDATMYAEWVATSGRYVHDYYSFYSDGTGIHGSYESDIDLVNEDEDIKWYTKDNKELYINGKKYTYYCDGSTLEFNGKTYRPL